MLDVDNMLILNIEDEKKAPGFSFKAIAKLMINRQKYGKDTIIVIIGDRRNGKSTYMLRLIRAYIRLKREANPNFKWSWEDNFAKTPAEAPAKAAKLPDGSFIVLDEAGDIAYRGDANTIKTKNLVKFFNKSGKKCLLTIWILPDIYQLNPKILNMAIMMIIVPYRFKRIAASAFIYMRSPNALTQDKFGLERIQRILSSKKMTPMVHSATMDGRAFIERESKRVAVPFPRLLFRFYRSLPTFKYSHWFSRADKKFEHAYIKNVKDKQLMAHETEEKYVRKTFYERLKKSYDMVLYNLHEKQGLSYQQISNLHRDENGDILVSRDNIGRRIGGTRARLEL